MYISNYIDAGTVKIGSKLSISFPFTDLQGYSLSVVRGCGCSSVTLNIPNNSVDMVYQPSKIPPHLQQQGYYYPSKAYDIILLSPSGEEEYYTLTFKAKVVK